MRLLIYPALLISSLSYLPVATCAPSRESEVPPISNEELFAERRIAEFWKDGDCERVKENIALFTTRYPDSQLNDHFQAILAEISFKQGNFEKALTFYQKLKDPVVIEKTIFNKFHCYYELEKFHTLIEEARPFIGASIDSVEKRREELLFLMGESLFRTALQEQNPDQEKALATEAQTYYDQVTKQEYASPKKLAQAEILLILGKYEEAATACHALAHQEAAYKEDLLFKAALAESHFDPDKALQTFVLVEGLQGSRSGEAAFNQIVLLFQAGSYEEVLSQANTVSSLIPDALQPTFQLIIGKAHFALDHYQEATTPLATYIVTQQDPSDALKNALLIQMSCAHYLNDEPLFHASFDQLTISFPDDPETPKALFMHAMLLKERGDFVLAEQKLLQIKESYPEFQHQESFIFEDGFLAYQGERWEDSYRAFAAYIRQFPEGARLDTAWKLFFSSSVNRYKAALDSDDPTSYSKEAFFEDLSLLADKRSCFDDNEWIDYTILRAKISYELDLITETLHVLQDHIFTTVEEGKEHDFPLAEAHYIAALCYSQLDSDYSAFCMHLEKTLELNPDLYSSSTIRKQLFNAYISLAGFGAQEDSSLSDAAQRSHCLAQAAQHLYAVVSKGDETVKKENILWLANHYYDQSKAHFDRCDAYRHPCPDEVNQAMLRADTQFRSILAPNLKTSSWTEEDASLDTEWIKWIKILGYQKQYDTQLNLLKMLIEQQRLHPEFSWNAKQEALFELALTYLALNNQQAALETFSFIQRSPATFPTLISNTAALHTARLQFQLLDPELKNSSSPKITPIFNTLKDLQICKTTLDFPNHLEAALIYVDIRAALASPETRDERHLFFLNRMEEDFNADNDPLTQNYLTELHQSKEKKGGFDTYMTFIHAEKLRLAAKAKSLSDQMAEMEELHAKALALYGEVKDHQHTPQPLFKRALQSIEKINVLTTYEE